MGQQVETHLTLPRFQAGFADMYERWLAGPLFRPWAEISLDEVGLSPGDRILDVACGTGIVARVAKEWLGNTVYAVGIDISSDMLAIARARGPEIEWRHGDASALPLQDGEQFDVVVCQHGYQFFPDKLAPAAEMRRALANGGRLAATVWRSDDEVPFFRELRRVAERHLGPITDQRHCFGEAAALKELLRQAGFKEVRVQSMWRTVHFKDGEPLLRMNTMALLDMTAAGKVYSNRKRKQVMAAIMRESAPLLQSYTDQSGLAFEISSNLATAKA